METPEAEFSHVGFVVIGRNEGDRLKSGLKAIKALYPNSPVVYVDSGSTDDSVGYALSLGLSVEELDLSVPFTAARARNAGFQVLLNNNINLEYVQFLDGDCEILKGWIDQAVSFLASHDDYAVVSGRRIERYPEASIYNALIDLEWNTPVGETLAVLGDMCVKVSVFKSVDGFCEQIIAAEDDDLCLRVRRAGFRIYRVDADMSFHDANLTRIGQWYRRAKRAGHGFANINHIHGSGPDKYFRRELARIFFWGGFMPSAFLVSIFFYPLISIALLMLYVLFIVRLIIYRSKLGSPLKISVAYGFLIFTSKTYEFLGALKYWKNHLLSRNHQLIEYK